MSKSYLNLRDVPCEAVELEGICEGEETDATLSHTRTLSVRDLKFEGGRIEIDSTRLCETVTPCPLCGKEKVRLLYFDVTIPERS